MRSVEEILRDGGHIEVHVPAATPTPDAVAPHAVDLGGRLGLDLRLGRIKEEALSLVHRSSSSDVAAGIHIATAGGGGRIATVATLIGVCISGAGAGALCVATGVVKAPGWILPAESKPAPKAQDKPPVRRKPARPARLAATARTTEVVATPTPVPRRPAPRRASPRRSPSKDPSQGTKPTSHEAAPIAEPQPASAAEFSIEQSSTSQHKTPRPTPRNRRRGVHAVRRSQSMKRVLYLVVVVTLLAPAAASAGTYEVNACRGWTGNGSWVAENSGPYATANAGCSAEGLVVQNTVTSGRAPLYAGARLTLTAPPARTCGTSAATSTQNALHGWHAGLSGDGGWIWCGPSCTTWGASTAAGCLHGDVGAFARRSSAPTADGCLRPARNGLIAMRDIVVTIVDDNAPASRSPAARSLPGAGVGAISTWRSSASDSTGIRRAEVFVDGKPGASRDGSCVDWRPRPCDDLAGQVLDPGVVLLRRWTSRGRRPRARRRRRTRADASRDVLVDNTPPAPPVDPQFQGGDGWRSRNDFTLRWQNPAQRAAPIAAVRYEICPVRNKAGETKDCVSGSTRGRNIQELSDLHAPHPGEWRLKLWLEDEAGNADSERSVVVQGLRLDQDAPDLEFGEPRASDPTRVQVVATDRTSRIGEAWVEARRPGDNGWRSLPTTLDAQGFSAVLDDERLPKGRYDLRARARDLAGNERTIDTEPDGRPASRTLPSAHGHPARRGPPDPRSCTRHAREAPLPHRARREAAGAVRTDDPAHAGA